jgi:hypothetical protein
MDLADVLGTDTVKKIEDIDQKIMLNIIGDSGGFPPVGLTQR